MQNIKLGDTDKFIKWKGQQGHTVKKPDTPLRLAMYLLFDDKQRIKINSTFYTTFYYYVIVKIKGIT